MRSPGGSAVASYALRQRTRNGLLACFLKLYDPGALPAGPELAALMGRFQFLVEGYDDDPAELYAIDDVRRFYWPPMPDRVGSIFCDIGDG